MECIFCKIAKGELSCFKIYEDDHVLAFLDISPVNPGHTLVITKHHFATMDEVDDLLLGYVFRVARMIGIATKKALNVEGYNVIVNNGQVAGQIIGHFHCHVIPRLEGDGLHSWPQQEYKADDAKKITAKIKEHL